MIEYDPDEFARISGERLLQLINHETVAPGPVHPPFRWVEAVKPAKLAVAV